MEIRIRQRLDFELTADVAVVERILTVGNRLYVEVLHSQVTTEPTLMRAVHAAVDRYLAGELQW